LSKETHSARFARSVRNQVDTTRSSKVMANFFLFFFFVIFFAFFKKNFKWRYKGHYVFSSKLIFLTTYKLGELRVCQI